MTTTSPSTTTIPVEFVSVTVGKDDGDCKTFHDIPIDKLNVSRYFRTRLQQQRANTVTTTTTTTIQFPFPVKPVDFQLFLSFIYSGREEFHHAFHNLYEVAESSEDRDDWTMDHDYFGIYELATLLGVNTFTNAVMDLIRAYYSQVLDDSVPAEHLLQIYKDCPNISRDNELAVFARKSFVFGLLANPVKAQLDLFRDADEVLAKAPGLLKDVMREIMEFQGKRYDDPAKIEGCAFHVREDDENVCCHPPSYTSVTTGMNGLASG